MDSQYNELKNEISQLKTWKESHTSAINAVDDYKTDQAQKTDRKVYVAIGILGVAVGIIEVIKRFGL